MSLQPGTKRELSIAFSVSGGVCALVALASSLTGSITWQYVCAQAAGIAFVLASAALAYSEGHKKPLSREDLILLTGSIKPFVIKSPISLIGMYRSTKSRAKTELGHVENLVLGVLQRSRHPAFKEDYSATWEAYRSGDFHRALRYSSPEWIEAVVRVAALRGDPQAKRILSEHF